MHLRYWGGVPIENKPVWQALRGASPVSGLRPQESERFFGEGRLTTAGHVLNS